MSEPTPDPSYPCVTEPCPELSDCAMVIGDRAWLPFQRAERALGLGDAAQANDTLKIEDFSLSAGECDLDSLTIRANAI
jgi:hypothetical protein